MAARAATATNQGKNSGLCGTATAEQGTQRVSITFTPGSCWDPDQNTYDLIYQWQKSCRQAALDNLQTWSKKEGRLYDLYRSFPTSIPVTDIYRKTMWDSECILPAEVTSQAQLHHARVRYLKICSHLPHFITYYITPEHTWGSQTTELADLDLAFIIGTIL